METKDILLELRNRAELSQDELAGKVHVTRQAVSRWENGETTPNTETLKLLSKLFDVSINTLLGSPRQLICQCCGMPMEDSAISREVDGLFNEEYCKWCYADGTYTYDSMDDLIDYCAAHMANDSFSCEQIRAYLKETLPGLNYWKRYAAIGGEEKFDEFKKQIVDEFNALHIEGMPEVRELNALVGEFVNFEYTLPNGTKTKFLDDSVTYLGNQLPCDYDADRCFGILSNMDFLLVCTYEEKGANPELIVYKKR
ncbi:zinc ribbon domain-containing protein [Feifania hominis]|uniref:Helix-turn-helix domain-containing protein n=1 Tax=Feifania hominis TaxID=2763660 RepID=A0A926HQM3_9FIRM|nr:zinc ribbon domain-containing protein [Feifania hominis]MBC8536492.1 helix-turn-helix domain-containing protein [Feifania hominis]